MTELNQLLVMEYEQTAVDCDSSTYTELVLNQPLFYMPIMG